jgi:serine/threonine-protein kinase
VLLAGIARAAAAWHARGTAHGALTPERVLVGAGDAVTLAAPPRPDGSPAPWPTYLAPEQIDGRTGDVRSDVYAFGLLGWEMLAGQQPWEGESLYGVVVKQREQDLPRLSTLRPGLPRAVLGAIEGCLHKAPGDRWQSAAEFLATLAPALPRRRAPRPTRRASLRRRLGPR